MAFKKKNTIHKYKLLQKEKYNTQIQTASKPYLRMWFKDIKQIIHMCSIKNTQIVNASKSQQLHKFSSQV